MAITPDLFLDARARLGEGPAWHPRHRQLLWVDILGHALHVTDPDTARDRSIPVGEPIGCAVPARGNAALVGLQSGIAAVDLATGRRVLIHDPERDRHDNRFNDGKCDPEGRFWAGTMAIDESPGQGSLYCLDAQLHVTRKIAGVSVSNGLAWSADARTMYYIDSPTREVVAYDYDRASGAIANRRVVYEVPAGSGFPDGMTIDAEDCLWVALWDGGAVIRIDPAARRVVDRIEMPVSRPTSCAFGGDGYRDLYITSARNLPDPQLAREPLAGGLFRCRPGVAGVAPVEFAGALEMKNEE